MISLAQRLQELRTQKGLSRVELADALGFARQAVEKYENGVKTPPKDAEAAIAGFFGVSPAYLRGETNDPSRQDSWMDMVHSINEEEQSPAPAPEPKRSKAQDRSELERMILSPAARELIRAVVREELRSRDMGDYLRKLVREEMKRK